MGKPLYTGIGRFRNPLVCPQGALGRYLMARFTLEGEPFPEPNDTEAWYIDCMAKRAQGLQAFNFF